MGPADLQRMSLSATITQLSWKAYIYQTWRCRNPVVFSAVPFFVEKVLASIKISVKSRLLGIEDLGTKVRAEWT